MSQSSIVRFPHHPGQPNDNDPKAAAHARDRIASLPSQYMAHAAPSKEDLVGAVQPSSPAAERERGKKADQEPMITPNSSIATSSLHIATSEPAPSKAAPTTKPQPMVAEPAAPVITPKSPLESTAKQRAVQPTAKSADRSKSSDATKKKGRIPAQAKPFITAVITFALLFLLFKAPIFIHELNFLTQDKTNNAVKTTTAAQGVSPDPTISIPKINVNAPVVYATNNAEANIQKDLESGVVHYANTAEPGQNGNAVIFGHSSNDWWEPGSYKFVFVLLDKLQNGDTFTVNYQSKQYLYQVYNTKVVEPTDLSVVAPTSQPEMTLITCTPPGTSWKRLVVQAKQISPAPSTPTAPAQTATTTAGQDGTLPGSSSSSITTTLGNWWEGAMHAIGIGKDDSKNPG